MDRNQLLGMVATGQAEEEETAEAEVG
jgi:hypothetical protein